MPELRLGKLPATRDKRDLQFARYVEPAALPKPPARFGHEDLFGPRAWGMLGNDEWGDCVWAGAAHETMLLTTEGHRPAQFTSAGVLRDYSAGTGFDQKAGPPGHNPTDNGTSVREAMTYRRQKGVVDATGKRHRIGAFLSLDPRNLTELYQALYLFQAVGIGILFPETAFDQFSAGKPWDVVPRAKIAGGHYVSIVAKRKNLEVVTWGALQEMTTRFFQKYCDEAWCYVSNEDLRRGHNPEGFDLAQLKADLKALEASQV